MSTNRYPGTCDHCNASVPANTGIYDWGTIYCSQAHMDEAGEAFEARKVQEELDRLNLKRTVIIPNMVRDYGLSEKQVVNLIAKASKDRTTVLEDLSAEETSQMMSKMHKDAERRERAGEIRELKRDGKCVRCSGAGGAEKWRDTGWTCYECGGSGRAS